MTELENLFTSQLAREFDEYLLVELRESILAAVANNQRITEGAYSNDLIKLFAGNNSMYFAVIQGTDDALKESGIYELKETQPKGGIYPLIRLPSFNIIPRRSSTLETYRRAKYVQKLAIQNESYEPQTLELFKDLEDSDDTNTIFMILDVCIDNNKNVHFNFALPSSDMGYIHMNIPYETVLDTYRSTEYNDDEPAAARSILKATLKDLDKKVSQQ